MWDFVSPMLDERTKKKIVRQASVIVTSQAVRWLADALRWLFAGR